MDVRDGRFEISHSLVYRRLGLSLGIEERGPDNGRGHAVAYRLDGQLDLQLSSYGSVRDVDGRQRDKLL